ncbi:unnamed protein product [Mycetohabitans rhizoxinica HKI 454]|uniref:Uncharacterized protein n=1 Tax=Mycetohabitans rhizoxinica (strain DSM 19002 / CIP 109453 / HKI 454) TaxID=882378 RepID=E5ARD8_MYCRK|nr:unnamed protein product [Mycetohabitans rhizoxinica HKI 454]
MLFSIFFIFKMTNCAQICCKYFKVCLLFFLLKLF